MIEGGLSLSCRCIDENKLLGPIAQVVAIPELLIVVKPMRRNPILVDRQSSLGRSLRRLESGARLFGRGSVWLQLGLTSRLIGQSSDTAPKKEGGPDRCANRADGD